MCLGASFCLLFDATKRRDAQQSSLCIYGVFMVSEYDPPQNTQKSAVGITQTVFVGSELNE